MTDLKKKDTLDDSVPVFGNWRNWYIAIIVFNIGFVLLMSYIFSNI